MSSAADLARTIEALLFLSPDPVPVEELIEACEVAEVQVRNALDLLAEELAPGKRGLVLKEVAGGFALATEPAAEAANSFLDHVGNGRIEQAYKEAAPLFRQRQALSAFRIAAQRFGMDKFKSASWSSREISGNRTLLKGTITLRDGTWWRNLRGGAGVRVLAGGTDLAGRAEAITDPPERMRNAIEEFITRLPRDAVYYDISLDAQQKPMPSDVERAAPRAVLVEVALAPAE